MSTSNPSHLLISRNPPRSPAHPQLAPTSTSRHSPAGTGSSPLSSPRPIAGAGPSFLGRWHHSADDLPPTGHQRNLSAPPGPHIIDTGLRREVVEAGHEQKEEGDGGGEEVVDVHPTFRRDAAMPGRVKVIVGPNEFWCHKEVLWFASPFFQGLLQGSWAETTRETSSPDRPVHPPEAEAVAHVPSSPPTDTDRPTSPSEPGPSNPFPNQDTTHGPTLRSMGGPARPSLSRTMTTSTIYDDARDYEQVFMEDQAQAQAQDESHKVSVYLDAEDLSGPGRSVADILRELRELPETPAAGARNIADVLDDPLPTLSEVEARTVGSASQLPLAVPVQPPAVAPVSESLAATDTTAEQGAQAQGESQPLSPLPRRAHRSTIRHSFSSITASIHSRHGVEALGTTSTQDPAVQAQAPGTSARPAADAVVELHEESAAAFQDFLFWAYPHLECKVTWTNVEDLLALSSKLIVPALQRMCYHFLLTHASGRPVMALALAEQHCNSELYREASRFVLDQPTWDQNEMEALSEQTQLKLSKRRNWFLERLLKLGSIDVKKEYTCRADCPDPARCQLSLDEKWRQAHMAVSRYGPPQPSVAFRCLRQLETFPTNPSLVMPHPLCQSAAKSWVMSLFDRMFQPKLVFTNPGTEKYWLWISMD